MSLPTLYIRLSDVLWVQDSKSLKNSYCILYKLIYFVLPSGQFRRVSTSTGGIPPTVQNTGTSTGSRVNTTNTIANTTLKKPKEPGYYYYDGGNFLVKCREVPRAEQEPPPVLIPEVSYEYANSSAPPVECSSYSKY